MIKKLQQIFSSLIITSDTDTLDKSYRWFTVEDKLIGIHKTELTEKDISLLSTFTQPYNNQFPMYTSEELKWKKIVEQNKHTSNQNLNTPYRFIYFTMKPNQISPTQFKEAIQELFSRDVPVLWQNSHEGIMIEEINHQTEEISYDQIIDILMSDLYVTINFFVGNYHYHYENVKRHYNMIIRNARIAFSYSKKPVITFIDAVPFYLINETHHDLRLDISETVLQEFIDDIDTLRLIETFLECNLNISETAKELYMHRNSLQYRLDRFHEKTSIDIRKFHEAMSVYLALLAKI